MTALRPDEVKCQWCNSVFVSPEAYEAHVPSRRGCWKGTVSYNGLIPNEKTGRWHFPGKDPGRPPRRTQAQAAFDRLVDTALNWPRSKDGKASVQADIDKVQRALTKARDA